MKTLSDKNNKEVQTVLQQFISKGQKLNVDFQVSIYTVWVLYSVRVEKSHHVNNFAVLCAIHMGLAPINSACKRTFYI